MIADFGRALGEGMVAPRQSARRLLDANHGFEVAISFLILAFLIDSIFRVAMPGTSEILQHDDVGSYLYDLIRQVIAFFVISTLVFGCGRISGGTGTRLQSFLVVGWYSLVTSLLTPVWIYAMSKFRIQTLPDGAQEVPPGLGGVLLLAMAAGCFSLWLLAQYVCELHGFKNVWGVIGVIVGIAFALVLLLTAFLQPG